MLVGARDETHRERRETYIMSKNTKKKKSTTHHNRGDFDASKAVKPADVISDPRFEAAQRDPRFMTMRRVSRKVKIDSRFKKMFDDENFRVGGGGENNVGGKKVDKFGRRSMGSTKTQKEISREGLESYYDLEEEEEEEEEGRKHTKPVHVDRRDLPEMDADMQAKLDASRDRMRGVGLEDSSSDDDEDDSDSSTSDTSDDEFKESSDSEELSEEGVLANYSERRETGHESSVPEQDATKRLALVNCEWQQIRAVDILTILRSFCPASGEVKRVTVYPSDFGLQRMKEENVIGPMGAVAKIKKSKYGGNELSEKRKNKKNLSEFEFGKEGKEIDNEQLRQYERDRLKYYYAIIECDSVKTAKSVYEQCDGLEFERSSALLDLRYVPNEQDFSNREVRDVATDTPEDYEPPEFEVKALRNSTVKLSWDEADPARKKTFGRKITEDTLKDDDFQAYLASDSEDDSSDDDDENEKEKKKKSKRDDEKEEKKKYLTALLGKDYKSKTSRKGVKLDDIDTDNRGKDEAEDNDDDDDDDFFLNEDDDRSGSESSSSSSEEIEDTALAATKYAMQKKFSNRYGNKSGKNGNRGDMEVTFHAGLEDFGTKMKKKKKEGTLGQKETAEERRQRERREKKLAAKKKKEREKKGEGEEEEEEEFAAGADDEANGFDDPFFAQEPDANFDFDNVRDDDDDTIVENKKKSKKKKRGSVDDEEDAKTKAELELLMMDENAILGRGDAQSFKKNKSLAKTTKDGEEKVTRKTKKARLAEKRKLRGKAARRAESDDEMDDEDNEENVKKTINVQDERFGALFENHEFALDPTDPRYKDVESKALIASEREKRRAKKLAKLEKIREEMLKNGDNVTLDEDDDFPGSASKKKGSSGGIGKNELDSMIQSLKRKQALAMQKRK